MLIGLRPLCQSLRGLVPIRTCQPSPLWEVKEMCGQEKLIHTALAPFGYECPLPVWTPRHSTLVGGMFNVVANACNYRQMMQNYLTEIAEIAHGSELTIEY